MGVRERDVSRTTVGSDLCPWVKMGQTGEAWDIMSSGLDMLLWLSRIWPVDGDHVPGAGTAWVEAGRRVGKGLEVARRWNRVHGRLFSLVLDCCP